MKKFSGISVAVAVIAATTLAGCPNPADPHTANFAAGAAKTALEGKSTYYAVNGLNSFYDRIVTNIGGFPVDPADATFVDVDFSQADPAQVNLTGSEVMYYGTAYSSMFIGSNGVIGLGAAGASNNTLQNHFSANQIALLPVDASDEAVGAVSYAIFEDSVVVTFNNVDGSQVQSEFFIAGTMEDDINIAYPVISADVAAGVVGLSNNQLANDPGFLDDFTNSELGSTNTDNAKAAL